MSQETPSPSASDPPRQPPQSPAPGPSPSPAMAPGDEAPPGTPGSGEAVCRDCGGSGRDGARPCATCQGTGKVNVGIGGG